MACDVVNLPGIFIDPDRGLESSLNPHKDVGIEILSGSRPFDNDLIGRGGNRVFAGIIKRIRSVDLKYEDQCTEQYYIDLFATLRGSNGDFERMVEVGCHMGGASSVMAGCIEQMDFDLDIVDISASALRFTYERIRRTFPEAAHRVRLFHGTLPQYVVHYLNDQNQDRVMVHHDGAHDFLQVTKDLSSLSFIKDRLHALIIQDTHLRGRIEYCNFVDLAVMAVFGKEPTCIPIGSTFREFDTIMMTPNQWEGNYFVANAPKASSFLWP